MKLSLIALVIIFSINIFPGMTHAWYELYFWFDIALHFAGGFFVAMFFYHYLGDRLRDDSRLKNLIIIVGATALVGVMWEFAEYIASLTLVDFFYDEFQIRIYFIGDLKDTITDLFMDIVGALALMILHPLWNRKVHKV